MRAAIGTRITRNWLAPILVALFSCEGSARFDARPQTGTDAKAVVVPQKSGPIREPVPAPGVRPRRVGATALTPEQAAAAEASSGLSERRNPSDADPRGLGFAILP
jgi:hypothetical protein